jgi:hypothetical protein
MNVAPPSIKHFTCSVCDSPEMTVSVIGYILGREIVMFNSSSDNASESKSPRPDSNHETSEEERQSDYYYDDSTGYEIYEEDDDDEHDATEN